MKIAIVAESFLPHINGVTHSLLRTLDHFRSRGHQAMVIAPEPTQKNPPSHYGEAPIHWLHSTALPGYPTFRVAAGGVARVRRVLAPFQPDLIHLAAPFVLGWRAAQAARQLDLPSVAVYQTEVPAYARRYGFPQLEPWLWRRVLDIHRTADLTLAPSEVTAASLRARGIPRVRRWGRGVDTTRFSPTRRDHAWRSQIAADGEILVGYVGRLAAEKQVEDLRVLADIPRVRLVIVGGGPLRERLQRQLPSAIFTGFLDGDRLAEVMAGLDVFVHPGELETFCQTIQEAMASGVPVVAVGSGGPLELVDQSHTGWLYPPGDLQALRFRVADLIGDNAKRSAFGIAARAAVERRSWDAIGDELLGHYADVLRTPRNSRAHEIAGIRW